MEALRRQHENTPLLEQFGNPISSVLDKASIHEMLAHRRRHIPIEKVVVIVTIRDGSRGLGTWLD